jgi:hypothetical protein
MKKIFWITINLTFLILINCGGGGGKGDESVGNDSASLPGEVTSISAQSEVPKFSGFDLQFKQGDYWLYDWKIVNRTTTDAYYPNDMPISNSITKTGTICITMGQSRTILDISFFKVIIENTGDAKLNFPWQYIASFNNKIYGFKNDRVYLVFDAQNGNWMGYTFFWDFSSTKTFNIDFLNGIYNVDYMKGTLSQTMTEYHKSSVGPYGYLESSWNRLSSGRYSILLQSEETLILIESSFGV